MFEMKKTMKLSFGMEMNDPKCWCKRYTDSASLDPDEFDESCAMGYMDNLGRKSFSWIDMISEFCTFKNHPRYFDKGVYHTGPDHSYKIGVSLGDDCKDCRVCDTCEEQKDKWRRQ
jgi:hypothetical protein